MLTQYEKALGQVINHQKTTLFFSRNTHREVQENIRTMFGAQVMTTCKKYLGLPMMGVRLKVSTFKDLQERVSKRVMGWKETNISKAGREVLIKTVAQAIPTYSMSIFKIPRAVCDGMNSVLAKYWWGQTRNARKIHWVNWGKLCTPKNRGGGGWWAFMIFMRLILRCWLSRREGSSMGHTRCSTECTKQGTSPHAHLWRPNLGATPLTCGVVSSMLGS